MHSKTEEIAAKNKISTDFVIKDWNLREKTEHKRVNKPSENPDSESYIRNKDVEKWTGKHIRQSYIF